MVGRANELDVLWVDALCREAGLKIPANCHYYVYDEWMDRRKQGKVELSFESRARWSAESHYSNFDGQEAL
jgi:hypothetical protein